MDVEEMTPAPFAIGQLEGLGLDMVLAAAVEFGVLSVEQVRELHGKLMDLDETDKAMVEKIHDKHWVNWNQSNW